MTLDELAGKVRWMRQKQREYFRTRSDVALRAAKEAEARVDQALELLAKGPDLFEEQPHA